MRQAQLLFLEELIQCDYQLRLELDERLLALHRTDLRVSNEADLLGLLLNVTEYLIAGGSVRTDSRGYGLVVIEQRFQKILEPIQSKPILMRFMVLDRDCEEL